MARSCPPLPTPCHCVTEVTEQSTRVNPINEQMLELNQRRRSDAVTETAPDPATPPAADGPCPAAGCAGCPAGERSSVLVRQRTDHHRVRYAGDFGYADVARLPPRSTARPPRRSRLIRDGRRCAARSEDPGVAVTRTVLPPLDVEVVAGDKHKKLHPGTSRPTSRFRIRPRPSPAARAGHERGRA